MTRGKAKQLRAAIEAASASLDDQTASTVPELYPEWDPSKLYTAGDRVQYGGVLYKCLQAHTPQETWSPTASRQHKPIHERRQSNLQRADIRIRD